MKSDSWIITHIESGSLLETFSEDVMVLFIDMDEYMVENTYDYLCRINEEIKSKRILH